jgi:uncharacterized coiled-coil protein SlyX
MREQLEKRLQELKAEFGKGEQTLQELEAQAATVRQTLLRITGAIQALEELLSEEQPAEHDGAVPNQERHATIQAEEGNA